MDQLELTQKPFIELQIEVLAEENRIKPKRVNKFIDKLDARFEQIKELNYEKILNKAHRLPLIGRPNSLSDDYPKNFNFIPPETLHIIGGFKTLTAIERTNYVDLAVCIPARCFEKKDIKNQKYQHKRALYLVQLACLLNGSVGVGLIDRLEFRYHQGDFLKPVLLITPSDPKLKNAVTFQLFAYPHPDCALKLSQLHPSHGNLAPNWFFKDYDFSRETLSDELNEFIISNSDIMPSPFYNSSILFDIEMVTNSELIHEQVGIQVSITEALLLTKVWLYQRELHQHFSFILSMFIAYLQTRQLIHQNMSSYQIFKIIIKSLAESDWHKRGLSYYEDSADKLSMFQEHFPVVFLSPSGNLNLCYNITIDLYNRLRHEALLSQEILAKNSQETFELLFLKKLDFINKFDVLVHIPKCTKKLPLKLEYLKKFMDHGVFIPRVCSENILNLVEKSLMDRVVLVQQSFEHLLLDKKWMFKNIPYDPSNEDTVFTLGILLEPEKSLRVIDVGPEAQTPEAEEFKNFWEPKCQLRLQNGIISETVVWHVDSFSQRRAIIKYILDHALKHADIRNIVVHYTLLERYISLQSVCFKWRNDSYGQAPENGGPLKRKHDHDEISKKPIGVGEEIFQKVLHGYNELNRIVRNIDNLKHSISSIQPFSHHLRSSSVFPPLPVSLQRKEKALKRRNGVTLFPENFQDVGRILYIEPIEILLTLDSTGKWPNDFEALEAAKVQYLIELAEALKAKDYAIKLAENYLDVLHGQFVYRLKLKVPKELTIVATACGKQEFQKRRFELEILPRLHSSLDQLFREKTSFSLTCRLVKRWLSCHLLTDYMNDITIDLLVAHLYLHPQPYTEPSSSLCGFRRFLTLLAKHDWTTQPLIVNFDQQLKIDEINRLKDSMSEDRDKYPSLVICTPYDKDISPWTKHEPKQERLDLICEICRKASEYFTKNILFNLDFNSDDCNALFRPNFKLFDLLIQIHPDKVQNHFMRLDYPKDYRKLIGTESESGGSKSSAFKVMPIVGMNVIEQYVITLRANYGNLAHFFYDKYGQRIIGVILKPESEKILKGDLGQFIVGVKKLGSKLVESVRVIKQKAEIRKIK